MKFRPIILFPLAAVLIALIYAFGETRTKPSAKEKPANEVGANTPHQHDDTKSFEYVLSRATSQLESSQADSVKALTQEAEVAENSMR